MCLTGKNPSDFAYLNQSNCYKVDNLDDEQLFWGIIDSFKAMRFEE